MCVRHVGLLPLREDTRIKHVNNWLTRQRFALLVNGGYKQGAMILTSTYDFAKCGEISGTPWSPLRLLNRLLRHPVAVQIEGASYRLRHHADLNPEHTRSSLPWPRVTYAQIRLLLPLG
ncbi:ATP-binding protein [Sulfitobacter sp. M22]|uniref:ATP-binding protein n=1 Tax=Sulfitobacter sp. M22 TaxID=2675332 RepID=UPI002351A8D2|nr:ATP-binding protein [Sulfitobacter sp. M22]